MTALSVQGVSSFSGKSFLVTALARAFSRRGTRVAPFKAQNMSNNARVVDGGEIGVAQYLQALAAGIEPDVRMNPILVKPEGDDRSQVVVLGRVHHDASRQRWRERPPSLWPVAEQALHELLREYELVILEGAGSPAETNLRSTDLSNMRSAHAADAPVLLVADIDRGGAFAHLFGTWALVTGDDRRRLSGFVLNKFRGDERLLAPAPEGLERETGMAYAGLLPFVEHGLPDEDGAAPPIPRPGRPRVAVVRYPTASNLDEFKALEQAVDLVWARRPEDLEGVELVVLPGSKQVAADLAWLRARGFDAAIARTARDGTRVLGICGGLQMLGEEIADPVGVDGNAVGLGLLPVRTTFAATKRTASVETVFASLPAPWQELAGTRIRGYEIRHGETVSDGTAGDALPEGRGFARGAVLGIAVHGLLEQPHAVAALLGRVPERTLDSVFEDLADLVEQRLDMEWIARTAGVACRA
ncbi:MAG TPA: cobyric acid synthase [Gaiellaceae bacterium]|nr:cobyric acid synthase [Gaiellaceae bacterium]